VERKVDAGSRTDITTEMRAGLQAYAAKLAALHQDLCVLFEAELGLTLEQATASVIASGLGEEDGDIVNLNPLFTPGLSGVVCYKLIIS
jgi:hypothetical protein